MNSDKYSKLWFWNFRGPITMHRFYTCKKKCRIWTLKVNTVQQLVGAEGSAYCLCLFIAPFARQEVLYVKCWWAVAHLVLLFFRNANTSVALFVFLLCILIYFWDSSVVVLFLLPLFVCLAFSLSLTLSLAPYPQQF